MTTQDVITGIGATFQLIDNPGGLLGTANAGAQVAGAGAGFKAFASSTPGANLAAITTNLGAMATGVAELQADYDAGNSVAFIDNNNLFIWQSEAPDENFIRISYPYYTMSLSITPDGKSLAVGGGHNIIVYNIEDNREKRS
jgi:hypothetical protein